MKRRLLRWATRWMAVALTLVLLGSAAVARSPLPGSTNPQVQFVGTFSVMINATVYGAPPPYYGQVGPVTIGFSASVIDVTATPGVAHWNFGDGTSANGTWYPVHAYNRTGAFLVSLSANDSMGRNATSTYPVSVLNSTGGASGKPDEPTATPPVTPAYQNVSFSPPPYVGYATPKYTWHFGDGTTSNASYPVHAFAPGIFVVQLIEANPTYPNSSRLVFWINSSFFVTVMSIASNAPVTAAVTGSFVNWTGSQCNGTFGFDELFVPSVAGGSPPYSYLWSFQDGSTNSTPGPVSWRYQGPGAVYTGLTVTDSKGRVATAAAPTLETPPAIYAGPPCPPPYRFLPWSFLVEPAPLIVVVVLAIPVAGCGLGAWAFARSREATGGFRWPP